MKKRILSFVLLLAMILTMVPVMASAEETNAVADENAADTGANSGDSQSVEPVDLTTLYVQEGLTALYTTFGEYASTADLSTGKWTDIINGKTATFGEKSHWKVGENGGVGFNIFVGNMTDADGDGFKETYDDADTTGRNVATTGINLTFGLVQLPEHDFTVEYLVKYKPVYVYDVDAADKIARDANGNKIETFTHKRAVGGSALGMTVDSFGWFTAYAGAIDSAYTGWDSMTDEKLPSYRGILIWQFNNPSWHSGNNVSSIKASWTNNAGLDKLSDIFSQNDKVNTYAVSVDETLTVAEDGTRTTEGLLALYRNGVFYNSNKAIGYLHSTANQEETEVNKIKYNGYQDYDTPYRSDQAFRLSTRRPTDFYTVRIYEVALTDAQRQQNYAVDVLLWYGIELDARFATDSVALSALCSKLAGYTCETDETLKAAKKAEIEAAIDGITLTSSKNTLYVQNGLTSLFTAFGADNGQGLVKTPTGVTWTNRVAGNHEATFIGSAWQLGADGGIGRKVIYGTLYTTVNDDGTKTYSFGAHNDRNTYWATTDHKLSLGLDLLPKDDFTVEYLAFYPPQYTVDNATGDLIPSSEAEKILNCAATGHWTNPADNSAVDLYPYQLTWVDRIGFLAFITDAPHGHIESQPAGAIRPRAEDSGCTQWGGTSGNGGDVYGWGDVSYTVDNRNVGRIAQYGLVRDEVLAADGVNIEATYSQLFDGAVAKSKTFYTANGKIANGGTNTSSQYFFGDDDTDFYLSHRIGATYYSLRVYDRVLDATERAQNMMADVIYFYDLTVSDALLADATAREMLMNVLAVAPYEMDATAKAAKKLALQKEIDDIQALIEKTGEMTAMYAAQENLVSLYSVYVPESLNAATGTWTNLIVGGPAATFEDATRWSINENGSIGYTAWTGYIADDGVTKNTIIGNDTAYMGLDGTNHARKRLAKLNLGLANLPDGDMTVEFLAMSKPVYVADLEESSASKVVYAKDASGDYLHAYNVFGAQYFNIMDYGDPSNGAIDQVGFFGTFSPVTDGAYWGGGRGTVHWMLETSWSSDRTWLKQTASHGGYGANSGLNISGDPFWTVSTIRTYGISIDETETVDGDTTVVSAVLSMYRDGGFYNSNAQVPNTTADGTYYDEEYTAAKAGFYLSSARPTDFYGVRVYNKVLSDAEKLQNHMVDLILYYDITLPAAFIADEKMMATLASTVAGVPFETDLTMIAAAALQIEDAIQSIYQTSKIYDLYVQDGLVANYTALTPTDTMASVKSGAWANRVAGGASATMGNSQYWRRNANGSVGYDIFYGTVDANGAFVEESSFNNYAVNGTRLDLGLAQLPKDNFTVEFVAQVNPVYVADAEGNKIGESYLMGSVPGSQQYGAAAYGAVYQLGYFAGFTTHRDGIHGEYTARGAIVWTTSATAWNWGNSTQISGWNKSTSAAVTDIYTPNGSVHTYAIQRTEFDDTDAAESYRGATYTLLRDTETYATRTLTKASMDEAATKNASYQPVDYATDDTGYFYLGERISIDYYAVRVYNRVLSAAEQVQNHAVDLLLYYDIDASALMLTDATQMTAVYAAIAEFAIETDSTLKASTKTAIETAIKNISKTVVISVDSVTAETLIVTANELTLPTLVKGKAAVAWTVNGAQTPVLPGTVIPVSGDMTVEAVLFNLPETHLAPSIKITEKAEDLGLRFVAEFYRADYLTLCSLYGKDHIRLGMLITPDAYVKKAGAFTRDALSAMVVAEGSTSGAAFIQIDATGFYTVGDTALTLAGTVCNFKANTFAKNPAFAAIAFIDVDADGDGQVDFTIYGEYNTKASASVKETLQNVSGATDTQKGWIDNLLSQFGA